jgi:hypothetical protein
VIEINGHNWVRCSPLPYFMTGVDPVRRSLYL